MNIKSKLTNLVGAEVYLEAQEIELIINTLQTTEEEAESDYRNALEEFQQSEDKDYFLCEVSEKHLQEIRKLLVSFEELLQSN